MCCQCWLMLLLTLNGRASEVVKYYSMQKLFCLHYPKMFFQLEHAMRIMHCVQWRRRWGSVSQSVRSNNVRSMHGWLMNWERNCLDVSCSWYAIYMLLCQSDCSSRTNPPIYLTIHAWHKAHGTWHMAHGICMYEPTPYIHICPVSL
jgi:hypothetical protein